MMFITQRQTTEQVICDIGPGTRNGLSRIWWINRKENMTRNRPIKCASSNYY